MKVLDDRDYLNHKVKAIFKIVNHVQGQGVDSVFKRSVHGVREHYKPNRNAAIGREMLFFR
jgi:hypothetical protein